MTGRGGAFCAACQHRGTLRVVPVVVRPVSPSWMFPAWRAVSEGHHHGYGWNYPVSAPWLRPGAAFAIMERQQLNNQWSIHHALRPQDAQAEDEQAQTEETFARESSQEEIGGWIRHPLVTPTLSS